MANLALFNVKDGYLEAVCRGMRSGFLTADQYRRLGLAEHLEDFRSALEDTHYGPILRDEAAPLSLHAIGYRLREWLGAEFEFWCKQASEPLLTFLNFVAREKMIDNIITIVQGTINKKSTEDLMERLDPIGWFPELRTVAAMDRSTSYDEVYRLLLVDTPIGRYFAHFLQVMHPPEADGRTLTDVTAVLNETDIELLRSLLKKAWLEDFHDYVTTLGGVTQQVMGHLLKMEADFRIIAVTLNTISTGVTSSHLPDRSVLYPNIGYLYPEGVDRLRGAWNDATIRMALEHLPSYANLYDQCKNFYIRDEGEMILMTDDTKFKSVEDLLYAETVAASELAFEQQCHYGIFYAYLKLKQQEIRNVVWIADMVLMRRKDQTSNIIPIFNPRA